MTRLWREGGKGNRPTVNDISPRMGKILHLVRAQGFVSIEALAERFKVTPQTVRRDINALCDQDLLRRYHGGAGLPSSVENAPYGARQVMNLTEKSAIAYELAKHIPNRASLFINIGTTTEAVAQALLQHEGLRIITNNLNVASILSGNPDFEVILAGGVVRSRDRGIVGEATIDLIRQFKVDYGIIGISCVEEDGTLLDYDYREVRVAQAIIGNSRKVILVADHSKFNRTAMVRLGHISQVDMLITDKRPLASMVKLLADGAVELAVAGR